jgi:hypothetical protein
MNAYDVAPKYRDGRPVDGEWVLHKGGHLTGISSTDWPRLEELCALLNLATQEQKDRAKAEAYRRTVLGVAA